MTNSCRSRLLGLPLLTLALAALGGCGEDTDTAAPRVSGLSSTHVAIGGGSAPLVAAQPATTYSRIEVDGFTGAVTAAEIASFRDYMSMLTPAADNVGNDWAQGASGEQTKALGIVYELGRDTATLDQMIRFCDAVLSERNDLAPAPVGQHAIWTKDATPAPVWPNETQDAHGLIWTGGEQGDPPGHLGHCARLILQTPELYNQTVPIGDPNNYGATYLQRAQTYVAGADYAIDHHILSREVKLDAANHQYFASDDPYKGGRSVPWNQQMMFNYAFQNLATAHEILGDDAARVTRYRGIVQASIDWFFQKATLYTDAAGNQAYNWSYATDQSGPEDQNHAALDVAGIARAYRDGHFGIGTDKMIRLANTINDVLMKGPGSYAGRVDGTDASNHGGATDYLRAAYLYLLEFRDDKLTQLLTDGGVQANTTSTNYGATSAWFWVKQQRSKR